MKYSLIKLKVLFVASFLMMVTSCVKERAGFTDLTQTSDLVILNGAGTGNFKPSNILVNTSSPDTVKKTVMAVLASNNSSNGAVTVTLGVDNSAIAAYNTANGTNFQAFPANAFKLVSNTLTIPGGLEHTAATTLWIFQNKLDPTVSYMLPVAITDGGGKSLSSNQNIIYYNVIGNVLAGNYKQDFMRWNGTTDTTTPPNSTNTHDVPVVIGPISATSLLLPEGYIVANFGPTTGVALSFTNTAGTLSNFSVSEEPVTKKTMNDNSFTVTALKLLSVQVVGNASTKYAGTTFRIYAEILNNAGAVRTTINKFVKQ
jgi:hypothetical protein